MKHRPMAGHQPATPYNRSPRDLLHLQLIGAPVAGILFSMPVLPDPRLQDSTRELYHLATSRRFQDKQYSFSRWGYHFFLTRAPAYFSSTHLLKGSLKQALLAYLNARARTASLLFRRCDFVLW